MSPEQLQAIEDRLKVATIGRLERHGKTFCKTSGPEVDAFTALFNTDGDCDLFEHAPDDLRALIEEVRRLQEENARLSRALEEAEEDLYIAEECAP